MVGVRDATSWELLTVAGTDATAWGWLGATAIGHPDLSRLRGFAPPMGVRLAVGEPGHGVEGFRLTHRQAVERIPNHAYASEPVTWHADIALLALTLQDPAAAREFVRQELGSLADDDERSELLRDTLTAYFATGHNAASAAAALGVHDRTVLYRLRTIEERLGRSILVRREELGVAPRLAPVVLRNDGGRAELAATPRVLFQGHKRLGSHCQRREGGFSRSALSFENQPTKHRSRHAMSSTPNTRTPILGRRSGSPRAPSASPTPRTSTWSRRGPRTPRRTGRRSQHVDVRRPIHAWADGRRSVIHPALRAGRALEGSAIGEVVASWCRHAAGRFDSGALPRMARLRGPRRCGRNHRRHGSRPSAGVSGRVGDGLTAYLAVTEIAPVKRETWSSSLPPPAPSAASRASSLASSAPRR